MTIAILCSHGRGSDKDLQINSTHSLLTDCEFTMRTPTGNTTNPSDCIPFSVAAGKSLRFTLTTRGVLMSVTAKLVKIECWISGKYLFISDFLSLTLHLLMHFVAIDRRSCSGDQNVPCGNTTAQEDTHAYRAYYS